MNTVLTRAFSGKLARSLKNRFIDELHEKEAFLPGYPIQNTLTQEIRQAAGQQDQAELMSLWAGQGCSLVSNRSAAELVNRWIEQVEGIFSQ